MGKVKTIDFHNREALKELTKSILMMKYKVKCWDVPENYLVPCFTMRQNYILWIGSNLISKSRLDIAKGIDMYCFAEIIYIVELEQVVFSL